MKNYQNIDISILKHFNRENEIFLDAKIPKKVMADMKTAFEVCEYDKKAGLTSYEVRICMEGDSEEEDVDVDVYEEEDVDVDVLKVISELDFGSSDLNGDGVLLFDEWKTWANGLDG